MNLLMALSLVVGMADNLQAQEPFRISSDTSEVRSQAVEVLIEQLSDHATAREAANQLVRFGSIAVPGLRRAMSSGDLRTRYYAASALSLIRSPEAGRALLGVLREGTEDPIILTVAARAMSRAGLDESVPLLQKLARGFYRASEPEADGGKSEPAPGGEEFRFEVVKSLSYLDALESWDILLLAIHDDSPRIRKVVAQGLGDYRVSEAVGELVALLDDPVPDVQVDAARALGKIGKAAEPAVPRLVALAMTEHFMLRRAVGLALAQISGVSFSRPEAWRDWLERRKEMKKREEESGVQNAAPVVLPALPRPAESGGPSRKSPALGKPWEWDDEDWSRTPDP